MFNDLSSRLTTEGYNTGNANVSSVAPHFFGLRINSVAGNFLSDYTALYNDSALHSLLMKIRFLLMLRNKQAMFWQLVFPIALITASLALAKSSSYGSPKDGIAMEFLPTAYDDVLTCNFGALPQSTCFPNASKFLTFYDTSKWIVPLGLGTR